MSKKKKIFLIGYVMLLIAIITIILSKIFAANNNTNTSEKPIKWNVQELGRTLYASNGSGLNHTKDDIVDVTDLSTKDWVFCIEKDKLLTISDGGKYVYWYNDGQRQGRVAEVEGVNDTTPPKVGDTATLNINLETDPGKRLDINKVKNVKFYSQRFYTMDAIMNLDIKLRKAEQYVIAVATGKNGTSYETDYQKALWKLRGEENVEENDIYKKAMAFESYSNLKRDKIIPKVTTTSSVYEFKYDNKTNSYIAGPMKIDYGNLTEIYNQSSLTVRKISNIKLYGNKIDGSGEEKIDGKKYEFIKKNGEKWVISDGEGNKYNFPGTGENFYIRINESVYSEYKSVSHFDVEFEILDSDTNMEVCELSNVKLIMYKWDLVLNNNELKCAQELPKDLNIQQKLLLAKRAELYWQKYKLKIEFDQTLKTIDIGGKVWIDEPDGTKENKENGIWDSREKGRRNVLAKLYYANAKPVIAGENGIIKGTKNTFEGDVYQTYTDENGNYMFYDLPARNDYYVEFTYDGMTYEIVEYLAGGNETDYRKNPNNLKYSSNSKVKVENDRQGFNKKFTTIMYKNLRDRYNSMGICITPGMAPGVKGDLTYLTRSNIEISKTKYNLSQILTTNDINDAKGENVPAKGKVSDHYKMIARTKCNYPLDHNKNSEGEYLKHINLGLRVRAKADFALNTQVKAGAMTIKDKEKVVYYKQSVTDEKLKIDGTATQEEYIKQEISASDYNWKANFEKIYGKDGQAVTGYVVNKDKLNVYVLYRILVQDQCEDANDYGVITEIVDYYDNRLEMVPDGEKEKAYNLFKDGLSNKGKNKVPDSATMSWIEGTKTSVEWTALSDYNNYKTIKTNGLKLEVGKDKSTSAIYLILKVKENGDVLETGTKDAKDGMKNIAEIGAYSVHNKESGIVGKIDKDSAPGNARPGYSTTYEDDTDPAPMFRLEINWNPRKIEGTVWDDGESDKVTNGKKDNTEKGIENVTVELWEQFIQDDGTVKEIKRPGIELGNNKVTVNSNQIVKTDGNGQYSFYAEGGNYRLKFIYGNTDMLWGEDANKKYNAQDYQATNYTALSEDQSNNAFATEYDLAAKVNNRITIEENDNEKNDGSVENNYSSVRDLADIRAKTIKSAQDISYENGSLLDELTVSYYAQSGTIVVDPSPIVGPKPTPTPTQNPVLRPTMLPIGGTPSGEITDPTTKPEISIMSLNRSTLTERTNSKAVNNNPVNHNANAVNSKADAIKLSGGDNKEDKNYTYMQSVSDYISLSANDIVTQSRVINLGLKERVTVSKTLEKEITRIVIKANDGTTLVDTSDASKLSGVQKLKDIQDTFINIPSKELNGATLDIDYKLTVTNNSTKNDKLSNYVYVDDDEYTLEGELSISKKDNLAMKMTVYDYVSQNLEYRADDNEEKWTKVYDEDNGLNPKLKISEEAYKVIPKDAKTVSQVLSKETGKLAINGGKVEIPIHLGITLSESMDEKDLGDYDFSNCAEIVQVYTGAGRRAYNTIPGDYVPYSKVSHDENPGKYVMTQNDADLTGRTAITQPLGQERIYYVITIISAVILIVGIVLIKKRVLKK